VLISLSPLQSKSFNSAHQIIGLVVVMLVLAQMTLGFLHHRIYKRTQRTTPMVKVHRLAGPVVILVAIVNGAM